MKWSVANDTTAAVITAEKHIGSGHGAKNFCVLPDTCVLFEMGMAIGHIETYYQTTTLSDHLPCFLEKPKCIMITGKIGVCFTKGGYGAPASADTLETIHALGVKRLIVAGLCGVFGKDTKVGDVILPSKILSEEGTSYHYTENAEYAFPETGLHQKAVQHFRGNFNVRTDATVSTDAVYRQTLAKEALWQEKGCIGVDMESSVLLTISRLYAIPAVSILLASDKHPINEADSDWDWGSFDFEKRREEFVDQVVSFALGLPPL